MIIKLYLPLYLLVSIIFVLIFKVRIIPDLVIVFLIGILLSVVSYKSLNNEFFPFTNAHENMPSSNTVMVVVFMFVLGLFIGLHFGATFIPYGVPIYMIVLITTTIVSWKLVFSKRRENRTI